MQPPAPRRFRRWSFLLAALLGLLSFNLVPAAASAVPGFIGVNTPVVSGSGVIGTDFSASLDLTGTTPVPTAVTYAWYRADTHALLQSGTATSLAASSSLEGTGVYVIATLEALNTQSYVTLNSPFSNTVHKGGFENVNTPVVSGSGVIGTDFSASLDLTGTTPVPTAVTYAWYRADTHALLQSGTATSLAASSSLEGTGVYVIATLEALNTQSYVTLNSPFSNTVHKGGFENVNTPVVSGSGVIGTDFSASLDLTGTTPVPTAVTYAWYRADTHALLQSGTATSLAASSSLEGTGVYVIATLEALNTQSYVTLNSPFSNTVHKEGFTPGDAPTLRGLHALFGQLTADIDTTMWVPTPTSVSWAWFLSDGTPIAGADQASLAMTADLVGKSVYAVATLRAADTVDYVIATPPSGRIAAPALSISGVKSVTAGSSVPFKAWGLLFDTEYTFELHSQPIALGARTSSAAGTLDTTFAIPASVPSGTHRLVMLLNGREVGSVKIEVVRESGQQSEPLLARTGAEETVLPALGVVSLMVVGGALVLSLSRRRTSTAA